MIFKHPGLLWLLLLLIPLIAWYLWKQRNSNATIGLSNTQGFDKFGLSWKVVLMHLTFALRLLAIAALIVAISRPQTYDHMRTSQVEGIDIAIALDISSSMSAQDLTPNRLEAAKDVASQFINARESDNMSFVIFAGESLSLMPLTNDRAALINALQNVEMGDLNDGTAVGDGLTSAINRLTSGKAKSKSIILLTDGTNNSGDVAPSLAAEIARQKGIKVYTIGVGVNGVIQVTDPYGFSSTTVETKIDEASLKEIANVTGGKYFRATDKRMLQNVFSEIDKLEKSRLEVNRFTQTEEAFMPWIFAAMCLFIIELLLRYIVLRRIP